jgi:pimeloyl-ACP methyl ester carboxylesterase
MDAHLDPALADTVAAESPKFNVPMVLVHGLWCTAAVWRRFMGYMAHRGWTCHAVHLRGDRGSTTSADVAGVCLADYVEDVHRSVAACPAPPVLVGHDAGGLLALANASAASAVVALAPLVPPALAVCGGAPIAGGMRVRIATWRAAPVPPPRHHRRQEWWAQEPPGGAVGAPAGVVGALCDPEFTLPACDVVPALVVGGQRDEVSLPVDVAHLAQRVGAEFALREDAAHAMPWEAGWEESVSCVHRWIVKVLGEPLLAFREEDDDVEAG